MAEGTVTIFVVGSAMALGCALVAGFVFCSNKLIAWQDKRKFQRIKQERDAYMQVFCMVSGEVGGELSKLEFEHAIEYTASKHHLGDNGKIEFYGSDQEYLAELITEAVTQQRAFDSTLIIAACDLAFPNKNTEESIA